MMNFEHTIKRRFQIVDFNVEDNNDIYINDILFEPILTERVLKLSLHAEALYDMFFIGETIEVNYYRPTDGRNFPIRFKIHYIGDNTVEFERI